MTDPAYSAEQRAHDDRDAASAACEEGLRRDWERDQYKRAELEEESDLERARR